MKRVSIVGAGALGAAIAAMIAPAYAHASIAVGHGVALLGLDMLHAPVVGIGALGLAAGLGTVASADKHATTSKFFRVAVEGATTDGRVIERDWITQMATAYNTDLYGARVNCEHVRGVAPMAGATPSPFGSYGDVIALRAEQLADGPLKGKMALFAQIKPTQALVDMNKASQKVYTSIEVAPSFADTKSAYMIGLAVTDSPASLGTEMLQFAAGQGDKNPLAGRKQHRDNLFTAAEETLIEFETTGPSISARIADLLAPFRSKADSEQKRLSDAVAAIEGMGMFGKEQAEALIALTGRVDMLSAELTAERDAHKATAASLDALKVSLSSQPGGVTRPPATGANGRVTTDC
ncbi:GPO family capsid scaffolding protein [Burkholderia gladioli]|uniref:GPO family capsid scaffolding protein n=1 Tax=Burkholderia gladioli TaxID=28095 RepID=UPI001FC8C532|nr:GPO family capsid scaffolding protein [Burkholderia gladioli]